MMMTSLRLLFLFFFFFFFLPKLTSLPPCLPPPQAELKRASSLKVKLEPGGDFVSNYKPVTKTEMLVLVFAVGLVCFKNPFKGILRLVQNSFLKCSLDVHLVSPQEGELGF